MKFYAWKMIGHWKNKCENHVVPASFFHPDHFNSLCGEKFGAMNGEGKKQPYCAICAELAPIAEAKAQRKEDRRIAKLERRRGATIEKIDALLVKMPIEALLDLYRDLKRNK